MTIIPFIAGAATRGLPVKVVAATTKSGAMRSSRVPTSPVSKTSKGKGWRSTPCSSADFTIYQLLSRNGLDPNKDVTLLSITGSPDARFAALIGGSVDATVVNSPFLNIAPSKKALGIALDQGDRRVCQNSHQRAEHVAAKN